MPPKAAVQDTRADPANLRERQIAAAAHARASKKNGPFLTQTNGTGSREIPRIYDYPDVPQNPQQNTGMSWETADRALLENYRQKHNLATPASFTSTRNEALLSRGIGLQSPTMVQRKRKQRQSKDKLALSVRKHFNSAAVNEDSVLSQMQYAVNHQGMSCGHRRIDFCYWILTPGYRKGIQAEIYTERAETTRCVKTALRHAWYDVRWIKSRRRQTPLPSLVRSRCQQDGDAVALKGHSGGRSSD